MYTYNRLSTALVASFAIALTGCIQNDLPYPHIQPNFTDIEVSNLLSAPVIDSISRNITLKFDEAADLENILIESYRLNPEGSRVVSPDLGKSLDLSEPLNVTVALYQDYVWTITAVQNIERYFSVGSQIGSSVIDPVTHTVTAYVPEGMDMTQISVEQIKLGGTTSVMTPDLNGATVDFAKPVTVTVDEFGRSTSWSIVVEESQVNVSIVRVDAWTNVAWLYGAAEAGKDNGFEYKVAGDADWTRVPPEWIDIDGGSFTARLIHLSPNTVYQVRASSDSEFTAPMTFTTGLETQLPNGSFDEWWQDGKLWNPWAQGGTPWWGTGNKGAVTVGQSNTVPTTDTPFGEGFAAMLQSKMIIIKFAAGNMFSGDYLRTVGTNGVLGFGREFSQRPTKLRGYLKYDCKPISSISSEFNRDEWIGKPDTAIVYIALTDWAEPYQIRTEPKNRQLFDSQAPEVIAYGRVQYGETVPEYIPFEIELEYRDTHRKPSYILVVASASKYGDYFTGGNGSVLCIDDFVLDYDY